MKLSEHVAETIIGWASKNPLVEVTGIVAQAGEDQRVQPMLNISSTPATDYRWDPDDMRAAYRKMDALGEEPYAFYHSHPSGRSEPSETDMEAALHVGMYYLIAYPDPDPSSAGWHLSAWFCLERGVLLGEPLELR